MRWQLLLAIYLILNTASYLLQRQLGQALPGHKRLVTGFFFLIIHYPIGLFIAIFSSPHLAVGWPNLLLLLVGSWIFPLINIIALHASKDVDAGHYTILGNLTPIVTIAAASLLLHESLNHHQLLGAAIIIISAFLINLPLLRQHGASRAVGIGFALAGFTLAGLATVYERWMLTRIGYGAYLVLGWGFQSLWMALIAWPERKQLKIFRNRENLVPIMGYALSGSIKGVCFLAALKLSGNASVFGAFASFATILIVPAAYVMLKEKQWLWLKIGAAATGTIGLVILNSA